MEFYKTIKFALFICLILVCVHSSADCAQVKNRNFKSINTGQRKQFNRTNDTLMLDYTFKDTSNRPVRLSDFRGKYVLIDLWYSGCGWCIYANRELRVVHDSLKNENIVFISISVDDSREKWIESITNNALPSKLNPWAGKYCPAPGTIILYTGGSGLNNAFVNKYDVANYYPRLLFIDPSGKLISDHPPRPDSIPVDHPEKLIDFIRSYLKKQN